LAEDYLIGERAIDGCGRGQRAANGLAGARLSHDSLDFKD
jgi:hypothetical protein